MPVKNPFKTDALQLGSNATSPFISKTIDNNLLFFDQAVGEVTLKDLIPSSIASTQNILNDIQSLRSDTQSSIQALQNSFNESFSDSLPQQWSPSQNPVFISSKSLSPLSQPNASTPALFLSDPSFAVIENFSFSSSFSDPQAPLVKISSSNDQPPRSVTFRNCSFSIPSGTFVHSFKTNVFFENCYFESNNPNSKISINLFKSASFHPALSSKFIPTLYFEHNPALFSGGIVSIYAPTSSIPYLFLDNCSASASALYFNSISAIKSSLSLHSSKSTPIKNLNFDSKSSLIPNKLQGSISIPEGVSDFTVSLPAPIDAPYTILIEPSQSLAEAQSKPSFSSSSQNQLTLTLGSNSSSFVYDKTKDSFSISLPPYAQNHEISLNWLLLT